MENNDLGLYEQHKSRFLVFVIVAFFGILRYLVQFEIFANLVVTLIALAPFCLVILFAVWMYLKDKENHVLYESLQKHDVFLKSFFKLSLAMLVLFVLFFPSAWAPVFLILLSLVRFLAHFSPEIAFLFLSYIGIAIVVFFLIFYFVRLYQKGIGTYQGSMGQMTKKLLYNAFFIFLFLLIFSAFAYPHAYEPIIETITGGPNSAFQTSLGQMFFSTGSNLAGNISATSRAFSKSLTSAKGQFAQSIADTTSSMSTEIRGKLSSDGGNITGDLAVTGKILAEGGIAFSDAQKFDGATLQELGYLQGVTGNIKDQLGRKIDSAQFVDASHDGILSSSDWVKFNNGQGINQLVIKNGNVGIGTNNPTVPLQVGNLLYVGKDREANFHLGAQSPDDYMFYIKETRDTNGLFVLEGVDGAVIRMDTFGTNTNFDNMGGGNLYIARDMGGRKLCTNR